METLNLRNQLYKGEIIFVFNWQCDTITKTGQNQDEQKVISLEHV